MVTASVPPPPPPPYKPSVQPVELYLALGDVSFRTVLWKVPELALFKARVVFVHGFCEHAELYWRVCDMLAQRGFECFFFDQRGAGLTLVGADKGKTDEFHSMNDLDNVLEHVLAQEAPNKRVILFGHSMGLGIILNYGITGKFRDSLAGCVVVGPLITNHPKTRPSALLKGALGQVAKVMPNFKFNAALDVEYIVEKGPWQEYLLNDPYTTPVGTLRQFRDMLDRGERLVDPGYVKDFRTDLPVLITHGELDYINDIDGLRRFLATVPLLLVRLNTYPNGRHLLFLENPPTFDPWFADVEQFLDSVAK